LDQSKIDAAKEEARNIRERFAKAGGESKEEPMVQDCLSPMDLLGSLLKGQSPPGMEPRLHVGRLEVLDELSRTLDRISNASSVFRCLVAPNGAGKTFTIGAVSKLAIRRGLAVAVVDLEPSLHFTGPQSRKLIGKIAGAIRTPGGMGMRAVLDALAEKVGVDKKNGVDGVAARVREVFKPVGDHPLADPFKRVLVTALGGRMAGNKEVEEKATRWYTAGYDKAQVAKAELGIDTILGDGDLFPYLGLLASVVKLCGCQGLVVIFDEASVLTHNRCKPTRDCDWAWVLNTYNAINRGDTPPLGLIIAGTEDLLHEERGLTSNDSLRSRLGSAGDCKAAGVLGPVLWLRLLSPEELYVLLELIRDLVFRPEDIARFPDEAILSLLGEMFSTRGAERSVTPRDVLKRYTLVAMQLLENSNTDWSTLMSKEHDGDLKTQ